MSLDRQLGWSCGVMALTICLLGAVSPVCAATVVFTDTFSRPNGVVGNGWRDTTGNENGNLVISGGYLTSSSTGVFAGIYRAANYSGDVTATATITDATGAAGESNRYNVIFLFGNNGTAAGGYGVEFYGSGGGGGVSLVELVHDGSNIAQLSSNFHFGSSITPTVTMSQSGDISGMVQGGGSTFSFDFGNRNGSLTGSNIAFDFGAADGRWPYPVNPTVANFSLTELSAVPEPSTWLILSFGFGAIGAVARTRRVKGSRLAV